VVVDLLLVIALRLVELLAQQPPPTNPPPDYFPAFIGAAGALLGVVATAAYQALNSRWQRAHERRGRAFDKRLELYTGFLTTLNRWEHCRGQVAEARAAEPADIEAMDRAVERMSGLVEDMIGFLGPMNILASDETKAALDDVVREVAQKRVVTDKQLRPARTAMRKELGVED
jgi:hypothetical protein